jgi:hypothetical protein
MAANFHDKNGILLFGFDLHDGIHWPTPVPFPLKFLEVNVAHPFVMGPEKNDTVIINGVPSVPDAHESLLLWPHVPIVPDFMNITFLLDLAFGSQKCWLPRLSVIAQDKPMTPALVGWVTTSFNCFLFTKAPTSLTLQPGTVETTPDLADFLVAAARALIELAIDALFNALIPKKPQGNQWVTGADAWRMFGGDVAKGELGEMLQVAGREFFRETVSRFLPLSFDNGLGLKSASEVLKWGMGATGISAPGVVGALLTALGGGDTGGVTPSDVLGDAVSTPDGVQPGQGPVETILGATGGVLENLFPPLKLL